MGLTKIRLLAYLIAVSTLLAFSYHKGKETVREKWDAARAQQLIEGQKLELEYAKKERAARGKIDELSKQLHLAKEKHDRIIADYNVRLQQSTERASVYRRQANSTTADRNHLAEHAARLDESLTKGRQVVTELRALVELRDKQLRILGRQLLNDREQINEATDEQ